MTPATPEPASLTRRHLVAALLAVALVIALAVVLSVGGRELEREKFPALLPLFGEPKEHDDADQSSASYLEHLKNQGIALQRRAFERADILPLYGSSELVKHVPDKPSLFFRTFPTGFAVAPVGKAGTTSLIMLQKLGAVGSAAAGRCVALSLSPSWFLRDALADHPYEGNFSRQQAFGTLLNPKLSLALKRDLARRMLLRPRTIEHEMLLHFLTLRLARGEALDRALYQLVWPLAVLQKALYAAQDHFETGLCMLRNAGHLPAASAHVPVQVDWDRLIAEASARTAAIVGPAAVGRPPKKADADAAFRAAMQRSPEWGDLELLLRGLHEIGVRTLVLCIPFDGPDLEQGGVSKEALELFTARLRALGGRCGAQVEPFEDHYHDVNFLADQRDHLSAKGWMCFNRALDGFYHADPRLRERSFARGRHKPASTGAGHG